MVIKKTVLPNQNHFARADQSRQIFSENKERLLVPPVFLKDGLLSEIRDRKRRRRVSLRRWVSWTSAIGLSTFLFVVSLNQAGLEMPLNVPVALEVPVPNIQDQKVERATIALSDQVMFSTTTPGATFGNAVQISVGPRSSIFIPVLALRSGKHAVSVSFYRKDGVLVASRQLDLKTTSETQAPKSRSAAKVTNSLHAFAMLMRPTLFTTKVLSLDPQISAQFREVVVAH